MSARDGCTEHLPCRESVATEAESGSLFPRSSCALDGLRRRYLLEMTLNETTMVCAQVADAIAPTLRGQAMIAHALYFRPTRHKCAFLYAEFDTPVKASDVVALLRGRDDLFADICIYAATTVTIARMQTTEGVRHTLPYVAGVPPGGGLSTASDMHLGIARAYMNMCPVCKHNHLSQCFSCQPGDRHACRDTHADEETLHALAEHMVSQLLHAGDAAAPRLWFRRYRADVAKFYTARGLGGHGLDLGTIPVAQLADRVGVGVAVPYDAASGNMSPLTMAEAKQARDTAAHDAVVAAEIDAGSICLGCGEFVCALCVINKLHVCRAPPAGAEFMKCHQLYPVPRAIINIPLTLSALDRIATGLAFENRVNRVTCNEVYASEGAAKADANRFLMHIGDYMVTSYHSTGADTVADIQIESTESGGTVACVKSVAGIDLTATAAELKKRAPAGLCGSDVRIQLTLFQVPAMFAELDTPTIVGLVALAAPTLDSDLVETGMLQLTASGAYNLVLLMVPWCAWDTVRRMKAEFASTTPDAPSMCTSTAISSRLMLEYTEPLVAADAVRVHLCLETDPTVQYALIACGIARILVSTPNMTNLERNHQSVRRDIEAMYINTAVNITTLREDLALLRSVE